VGGSSPPDHGWRNLGPQPRNYEDYLATNNAGHRSNSEVDLEARFWEPLLASAEEVREDGGVLHVYLYNKVTVQS
jgi:hypothetical protein